MITPEQQESLQQNLGEAIVGIITMALIAGDDETKMRENLVKMATEIPALPLEGKDKTSALLSTSTQIRTALRSFHATLREVYASYPNEDEVTEAVDKLDPAS